MAEKNDLTAKAAAQLVRRTVPALDKEGKPVVDKDGRPTTREVAIREDEVFAFRDHGDRVVVVTVDGQKFAGRR